MKTLTVSPLSRFGRSLVFVFAFMSGNLNSAMEPVLALDRWIRYTQSELQSLELTPFSKRKRRSPSIAFNKHNWIRSRVKFEIFRNNWLKLLRQLLSFLIMYDVFEVLLTALLMTLIIISILVTPTLCPRLNLLTVKGPHNRVKKCFTPTNQ